MKIHLKKNKLKSQILVFKFRLIILDNFNFNRAQDFIFRVIEKGFLKKKSFL